MFDLACGDEFLRGARYLFDRHRRVSPVLVQKIDGVGLQPFQHRLNDFPNVVRAAAVKPAASLPGFWIDVEAEFRRDHHLIPKRRDRFAYQFFIRERAIGLGGIEECYAPLEGCSNDANAGFTRLWAAIG